MVGCLHLWFLVRLQLTRLVRNWASRGPLLAVLCLFEAREDVQLLELLREILGTHTFIWLFLGLWLDSRGGTLLLYGL